jgi:hypothetical protein
VVVEALANDGYVTVDQRQIAKRCRCGCFAAVTVGVRSAYPSLRGLPTNPMAFWLIIIRRIGRPRVRPSPRPNRSAIRE